MSEVRQRLVAQHAGMLQLQSKGRSMTQEERATLPVVFNKMPGLYSELRTATAQIEADGQRIAELEATVKALVEALRELDAQAEKSMNGVLWRYRDTDVAKKVVEALALSELNAVLRGLEDKANL